MGNKYPQTRQSAEYEQQCDDCDEITSRVANYCPACGAQLRGDEDAE